ncbi:hypothetical protein AGMMS50293_31420 [Spirochaetia bacterium]|nr:hypothetical protein AGMMS50293_31420 [Spirochaetia bacterium]
MIVRIFKYKWFAKFAEKAAITDADLREAVKEIEAGLVEANYGGDVYKKRIARPGEGKRGNINEKEERYYKDAAKRDFSWSDDDLEAYKKTGQLIEI